MYMPRLRRDTATPFTTYCKCQSQSRTGQCHRTTGSCAMTCPCFSQLSEASNHWWNYGNSCLVRAGSPSDLRQLKSYFFSAHLHICKIKKRTHKYFFCTKIMVKVSERSEVIFLADRRLLHFKEHVTFCWTETHCHICTWNKEELKVAKNVVFWYVTPYSLL